MAERGVRPDFARRLRRGERVRGQSFFFGFLVFSDFLDFLGLLSANCIINLMFRQTVFLHKR